MNTQDIVSYSITGAYVLTSLVLFIRMTYKALHIGNSTTFRFRLESGELLVIDFSKPEEAREKLMSLLPDKKGTL